MTEAPSTSLDDIVGGWLGAFEQSLSSRNFNAAAELFRSDGYWRDLLALTWRLQTFRGPEAIGAGLRAAPAAGGLHKLRLEGAAQPGQLGQFGETIDALFTFETADALGCGVVHLTPSDQNGQRQYKALAALTSLSTLKAFPAKIGPHRERSYMRATQNGSKNWLDKRIEAARFEDRDPQVLVVGAGQAGLIVATELGQLGVDTLVIDREHRIGDSWRKRYHSLKLHNEAAMNHLPYMPFPPTWPVYIPKDKLANWLEFYADAMELNVWTETTLVSASYDAASERWTVLLKREDGGERIMHPRHVVMATGISGVPNIPAISGANTFPGPIYHSTGQNDDLDLAAKSVLVIGTGTSAHDIAQDLCLQGAEVTMLQRSSTTVVSVEPSAAMMSRLYSANEGIRPIGELDLINASVPYDLLRQLSGPLSRQMADADRDLLDGLRKAGFALDNGEDDTGFFMKILRYHSGYYLNVGASELIIEGRIKVRSGVGLEKLDGKCAVFTDGSRLPVDAVVLATGYRPQQEAVRRMFGDAIADLVGPVWGLGEDGELRNMFGPTRQEGFYIVGGPMVLTRSYSRYTALSIKAELEGLSARRPPDRLAAE